MYYYQLSTDDNDKPCIYTCLLYTSTAATGDVSFAKAAIELELDFIANNGGMYYGNCDVLTSSFRESAMYSCFYAMLNSPAGDSTAFMSMLKFIWQEAYWNLSLIHISFRIAGSSTRSYYSADSDKLLSVKASDIEPGMRVFVYEKDAISIRSLCIFGN